MTKGLTLSWIARRLGRFASRRISMILLRLGNSWAHRAPHPATCTDLVPQITGTLIQLTASRGPCRYQGTKSRYLHQRAMQELELTPNSCSIQSLTSIWGSIPDICTNESCKSWGSVPTLAPSGTEQVSGDYIQIYALRKPGTGLG